MTAFIKRDGVFKKLEKVFLKDSLGTWKGVVSAYIKDSLGVWKLFFGAEYLNPSVLFEPALVSNDSLGRFKQGATLSLDRGIWDKNPTSYSLVIQASYDGITWDDVATSSGTSTTYLIDVSDSLYPSTYFRGKVTATNTYGSSTFYTLEYPAVLILGITGSFSSATQNGATFSWTVNPSNTSYRVSQRIEFYSVSNPSVTPVYTFNVPTSTANSAVVSNSSLLAGTQYNAVIKIVSFDTSNTVNFSSDILFTTAASLVNTVAPTITGTKQEGQTVTADPGTWSGNGTITYAYQWQRGLQESSSIFSYTDISGATGSTYFIPYDFNEINFGGGLRLKVTATTVDTPGGVVAYSQNYLIADFARPVGTDDTVVFSRDSSTSYNFSITNTGTWTGSPTSYRYQWYTYESTFGGNFAWFEINGATSSTFNASGLKLSSIMPIVWASNAGGESNTGYSLTNTNGTRPTGNIGSISAAATQVVRYTAPIISSFSVTGGAGSATYTYSVTGDDPGRTLSISYSGAATGSFIPGASGSTQTGLSAGTYNFVLTVTNSSSGNNYSTTSSVANVVVTAPLTAPVNTTQPVISPTTGTSGTTTFSVTTGTWTGNPTPTYTYQWQYRDQGVTWINISGATSSTFLPADSFGAWDIRCRVTATNSQAPSGVSVLSSNTATTSASQKTITYFANGGTGTTTVASYTYGATATVYSSTQVAFSRTNFTFTGWNTLSNGAGIAYSAGNTITMVSNISLYAQWSQNPQYTVTYNANGGSVSPASDTVFSGNSVTFPTPSRSGYTFAGWYNASSGGTFLGIGGSTYTPTASITIYAQWNVILYTITYNGNGGSTPGSVSVNAGSSTTLANSTRANFTFGGWYTAASGGTFVGGAGASYTPPSSITLYAQWVAIPIPNISSITVTGNVTAGVTISAVMTDTFSVQYTIFARDTTTSAWIQTNAGTASANGTALTTAVSTTSSVGTLPDQYYVVMQPFGGPRSTAGANGGTGTAGTSRSTVGSPKSNASGFITVNY